MDARGNAVFPLFDDHGLCGLDRRNVGFKGLLPGSIKGLWTSRNFATAPELLVVESPVDALAHYELYQGNTGYISIGGSLSTRQRHLLGNLLAKAMGRRQTIVAATDNLSLIHI